MRMRLAFLNLLMILNTLCTVAQADSFIIVNTAYQISKGDYGQEIETKIESIPLGFTYINNAWSVQLGIAYLRIKGDGSVVPGAGGTVPSNIDINSLIPETASGRNTNTTTSTEISSSSGIGDTNVGLSYTFIPDEPGGLLISLDSQVKLATADAEKNLGTGENDYFLQLNGSFENNNIVPFFTIGYVVTGDTEQLVYNDVAYGSLGFLLPIGQTLSAQMIYDYRGPAVDGTDSFQQIGLSVDWKKSAYWSATINILSGLTDAAPDTGISIGLTRYY